MTRAVQSAQSDRRDGQERFGAYQALDQLAADLEATAATFEAHPSGVAPDEVDDQ